MINLKMMVKGLSPDGLAEKSRKKNRQKTQKVRFLKWKRVLPWTQIQPRMRAMRAMREKLMLMTFPMLKPSNESSDYTPFLKDGVPEKLKRLALRKLWKSNPAFGFIDGLDDYDEDYSAIGIVAQEIFTNYKPGKGMVDPDETEEEIDEAVKAEGEVEPEEEARDLGEIEAEEDEVAGNEKSVEEQTVGSEGQKVAVSDDIAEAETGDLEKPILQNSKKASQ